MRRTMRYARILLPIKRERHFVLACGIKADSAKPTKARGGTRQRTAKKKKKKKNKQERKDEGRVAMIKSLVLCAVAVILVVPAIRAQEAQATNEELRLEVQMSKNGTIVASPVLRVAVGSAATVSLTDNPTFVLAPTRVDANTVRVACDVKMETVASTLRIDLRNQEQGSGSVTVGPDAYQIKLKIAQ